MEVNKRWADTLVYIAVCILTFGGAAILRVIISMAIRSAGEKR